MQFSDESSDLELRLLLKDTKVQSSKEIHVDVDENSLAVRIKQPGSVTTLIETKQLYDRIKPGETIWYTPLDTKGLLDTFGEQSIESWVTTEGSDAVAEAEAAVLDSLSSHVRAVIATLGGKHGAAGRADKWRHLYGGFTVWLSQSEATDEDSAKKEARKQVYDGCESYSKADVVVKFHSWDTCHAKTVAQASLSALKQLILLDKKLPGKKSLYIRLGCRGDWPNIKPHRCTC